MRSFRSLLYAPGDTLDRVSLGRRRVPHGTPVDKWASGRRRRLVSIDSGPMLRAFARRVALDVLPLWENAPVAVREYLTTGDETKRAAAWAAAWAARAAWAATAATAATAAAWSAAWATTAEPALLARAASYEIHAVRWPALDGVQGEGLLALPLGKKAADVVVIPRNRPFRMAFPLRIVESLVMRRPLIVTTVCDMHKLIQGCGIAVEPGDPQGLAGAMIELAVNKKLYQECQKNCAIKAVDYDSEVSLGRLRKELIEAID